MICTGLRVRGVESVVVSGGGRTYRSPAGLVPDDCDGAGSLDWGEAE